MATTTGTYHGRWRTLPILGANVEGTIHDDDEARTHGFRRAIVGGSSVAQAAMPAVVDRFGQSWMEGGWITVKFAGPVYPDEEVREVAEPAAASGAIDLRIEARDGRVAAVGQAGLGTSVPWRAKEDGRRDPESAFPELEIGYRFPDVDFTIDAGVIERVCVSAGDDSPWYTTDSPWGAPIAPPIAVFNPTTKLQRDLGARFPVHQAGMNAEYRLATERPMFRDHPYLLQMWVVDKGVGARTWSWTTEFTVNDQHGTRCLTGRQQVKWFVPEHAEGAGE